MNWVNIILDIDYIYKYLYVDSKHKKYKRIKKEKICSIKLPRQKSRSISKITKTKSIRSLRSYLYYYFINKE
jgi:hypothetical protein